MNSQSLTEANRKLIRDFAGIFYGEKDVRKAFLKHVAEDYIQHNPNMPDGREAAIEALEPKFSSPSAVFNVKRILVDGNLAATHLHGRPSLDSSGAAVVDLYRLENGKIVEHWDVLQAMPQNCVNPRPMF